MSTIEKIGRFKIERTLGSGASGVVYLAYDPLIDRRVAVKTLRTDLDQESCEETRERFLREARVAGRLSHPNIVTIFDVGEDPEHGLAFIAMEYLGDRPLSQTVRSGSRLDLSDIVDLGVAIAGALGYAHSQGVVHRDIKPANIIFSEQGAKITDFGIARLDTSDLTTEGTLIGTPYYMSPEQVRGRPVDRRTDLYSLGAILYQLITGQRPFRGSSLPELALNIVQQPVPDPRVLCPTLPEALAGVIVRCLAKNVEDRFQTGEELARALDTALAVARTTRTTVLAAEPADGPVAEAGRQLPPPLPVGSDARHTRTGGTPRQVRQDGRTGVIRSAARSRVLWSAVAGLVLCVIIVALLAARESDSPTAELAEVPRATAEQVPVETHRLGKQEAESTAQLASQEQENTKHLEEETLEGTAKPSLQEQEDTRLGNEASQSAPELSSQEQEGTELPGEETAEGAAEPVSQEQEQSSVADRDTVGEADSEAVGTATLVLVHKNRLKEAMLSFWIDDEEVLSQHLSSKNGLKRLSGDKLRETFQIPAGWHKLTVTITGKEMKVAARSSIEVRLVADETRTLRASLALFTDKLQLSWDD